MKYLKKIPLEKIKWLLVGLFVFSPMLFFMKSCFPEYKTTEEYTDSAPKKSSWTFSETVPGALVNEQGETVNAFGDLIGEFFTYDLPNGESVSIPKGGFEEKILELLSSNEEDSETVSYYIFDRIYFETGSAEINHNSSYQIDTVAKILNAFPNRNLLLRGHTDNTGTDEINNQLSLDRAVVVQNSLIEKGIDASRISVEGKASNEPIADNADSIGRARNRRIDISFE
ncbi:MAG: OmpA family protein [Halobacteriovoraceae bacterium]|nr:OmpA family protein [Halobacteriovoraceae bacterium]